jgi:hypothetical protein
MTLRETLCDGGRSLHEYLDRVLDSEDGVIVLADERIAIAHATGFALSATQLESLTVDVERLIRQVAGSVPVRRKDQSEPLELTG